MEVEDDVGAEVMEEERREEPAVEDDEEEVEDEDEDGIDVAMFVDGGKPGTGEGTVGGGEAVARIE